MTNQKLVKFIKEARKKGFDDYEIKEPLLKQGWPINEIEKAFSMLKPRYKFKNKICIYLDSDVLEVIEKRAKKNMFTVSEQIDDILRRSAILYKQKKGTPEKVDDLLVSIFSRQKRGKRRKK